MNTKQEILLKQYNLLKAMQTDDPQIVNMMIDLMREIYQEAGMQDDKRLAALVTLR